MGLSSSKAEAPPSPAPREGKFGVRVSAGPPIQPEAVPAPSPCVLWQMTNALLESAHANGGQAAVSGGGTISAEQVNEIQQRAFQDGVDYAAAQHAQQQAAERESVLSQLAEQNAVKKEALAARIEELRNREYRPPTAPMGCKEERDAVMARQARVEEGAAPACR